MSPFAGVSPAIAAEVRLGNLNVPPPTTRTATGALKSKLVTEDTVGVPAPEPTKFAAVNELVTVRLDAITVVLFALIVCGPR